MTETTQDPGRKADPNPYLNARREWQERYGDHVTAAANWRLAAICSAIITAIAVTGLAYTASQNHYIPYVVQVDKLGVAVPAGRADVASRADERIVRAQLARWISNVRSVYVDAAAQRSIIDESYAMVSKGGSAFNLLNDNFRANSPFERAQKETVTIEVSTVLPMAGDSWRVEWKEITRGRDGRIESTADWQAAVTIQISPPTSEVTILRNPLGIYVVEFSWTKRA